MSRPIPFRYVIQFLLELKENFLIALRAVGTHKMRAVLTTLGIIIGIIAVTVMATVINGVEADFDKNMASLGVDVLYVEKWPWVGGPSFKWWEYINRPEIKAELADVVMERSRYVTAAVPVVSTRRSVRYLGNDLERLEIQGASADYARVHDVDLEMGRFFGELDDRSARAVAVIGANVAEKLFVIEQPLGKSIRIGGNRFIVVGVMKKQGSGSDGPNSVDDQVKIPLGTFENLYGIRTRDVSVQVRVESEEVMDAAIDEVTGILRVARGLDAMEANDFEINRQQSVREQLAPVKLAIYGIGIFLTSLSLLVGGIGVMNIMFVSVKERTREIGIRKAVGAKRRAILTQFLIEAVFVCLIGGLVGVAIALGLTGLIRIILPAVLPLSTVALAFVICLIVGVVFGLAPAWTAARAEPIEALRYE